MPTPQEIIDATGSALLSSVSELEDMRKKIKVKTAQEISDGLALIGQLNHADGGQQFVSICPDPVVL